jgi:adenine-specific DNA-methyltransferase
MLAAEAGTTLLSGQRLLAHVERARLMVSPQLDAGRKALLGQFFTAGPIARLMCSMLVCPGPTVRLLDAGAGVGTLFAAVVAELCDRPLRPRRIRVTAYELDGALIPYLLNTLDECRMACERAGIAFSGEVRHADFICGAVAMLRGDSLAPPSGERYDCAILNPPYRKIRTRSEERQLLQRLGIETTNLYTGFLAAAAQLLDPAGELVAITPRSFCNGPYFKDFRHAFLGMMALRRIHLFESRGDAFRDDTVLQENVIIAAVRATAPPDSVTISTGTALQDELVTEHRVPYAAVVAPGDPHAFIRIVLDGIGQRIADRLGTLHTTLAALGIGVSTGRVVDFRVRTHLRPQPGADTVPLLYPAHFSSARIAWPGTQTRKPNALALNGDTRAQLVPNATYVLVKRFSSKEERRRIVAAVIEGGQLPGASLGFENHLNYFHRGGSGLDLAFARGLATFLNSTLVDEHFRQFNGHTQVNATDLRNIRYPTAGQLRALGARVGSSHPGQQAIDTIIEEELFAMQAGQERDPIRAKQRIAEALDVLKALKLPKAQQNERSALALLALLHLGPDMPWPEATAPLLGITPMMEYFHA